SENPTYTGLWNIFDAPGIRLIGAPVTGDGMDLDFLSAVLAQTKVKLILASPNFQNPTGRSMPLAARQRLLELAKKFQVPVIEEAVRAQTRNSQSGARAALPAGGEGQSSRRRHGRLGGAAGGHGCRRAAREGARPSCAFCPIPVLLFPERAPQRFSVMLYNCFGRPHRRGRARPRRVAGGRSAEAWGREAAEAREPGSGAGLKREVDSREAKVEGEKSGGRLRPEKSKVKS